MADTRSAQCVRRSNICDSCGLVVYRADSCQAAHMLPTLSPRGPQVIAFEFGRDVMERLRGAHPAVSAVMEIMLTDIGADVCLWPH